MANFLIESSIYQPDPAIGQEVSDLLMFIEGRLAPGEEATLDSTKAAYLIVFGDDAQVGEGLELAQRSLERVDTKYRGYCELYIARGWQRRLKGS